MGELVSKVDGRDVIGCSWGSYLSGFESCSRASLAVNGRLWPCGWALTGYWGSPIRRDNRVSSPGFAGTEPPEGLLENGDLRKDGARAAESWPLPCKSRDSSKMYTVVEHVEILQDKLTPYIR